MPVQSLRWWRRGWILALGGVLAGWLPPASAQSPPPPVPAPTSRPSTAAPAEASPEQFAERLRKSLPVTINGTGEQSRDFVYVADVVDALLIMADSRLEGTWNVGTGRAVSILELLRALEAEIRPAVEVRHGPARQGDVKSSRLSIEAIGRDLGWHPGYDLARGVASMA